MKFALTSVLMTSLVSMLASCSNTGPGNRETETAEVSKVIHASIEWAINKDRDLLLGSVAQDSTFFIFHPDSASTIVGFDAFRDMVDNFFMNKGFRATGSKIKDLKIHLSRGGDVAWFSALLDDFGEWRGKPTAWVDCRWTGVLEKREGKWVIVQMHFSFAK